MQVLGEILEMKMETGGSGKVQDEGKKKKEKGKLGRECISKSAWEGKSYVCKDF